MTYLRITVDGTEAATVDTGGRDVVSINVGGTRTDDVYADLGVTGGTYDTEGITDHRIWIDQMPLRIGQMVGVEFVEHGIQTGAGSSLDDLYPGSAATEPSSIDLDHLVREEKNAALVRAGYVVRLTMTSGISVALLTRPDDHGFGLTVLWSKWNSDRVSVSLRTYTADSLATNEPARYTVREKMSVGGAVRLKLLGQPDLVRKLEVRTD